MQIEFSSISNTEQEALFSKVGYLAALMWQEYLKNGGDENVFKNASSMPQEQRNKYLESKKC